MKKPVRPAHHQRPKIKAIKNDKFSDFQKLILPLLAISLLFAIATGNIIT